MTHISYFPKFPKNVNSPLFSQKLQIPPIFVQFTFFWFNLRFIASPYFDHDAFMYHFLHVLDAPDEVGWYWTIYQQFI